MQDNLEQNGQMARQDSQAIMMSSQLPEQNGYGVQPQVMGPSGGSGKSKKTLFIGLGVASVVLVIGVVVGVMAGTGNLNLSSSSNVGYGESYRAVKKLANELNAVIANPGCMYMQEYLQNTTATTEKYEEHLANCLKSAVDVDELVNELETSDGVKKVAEVREHFNNFKQKLAGFVLSEEVLQEKVNLYRIMHQFVSAKKGKTKESELREVAEILINSGNEELRQFGEEWLSKELVWVQKVDEYQALDTRDRRRITLKEEANDFLDEIKTWERERLPNLIPLNSGGDDVKHEILSEFTTLQEMITENYEQNYDEDSGDCSQILDEVICY